MNPVKIRRNLEELIEDILEHIKGVVLVAFIIVGFLSAIVGYRYYSYAQDDPRFCASCHPMQDAFNQWQRGKHRDVACQECHQLSMIEKDRLLLAYVFKGNQPLAQTHGREKPWETCRDCHLENISENQAEMRKSYGHARHVFMLKLKCKVCHGTIALHNFSADEAACRNCHKDKGMHPPVMKASCLKCHPF